MSLNFLGLGFSFGAKDDGLLQMQKDVHQGFKAISAEIDLMPGSASTAAKATDSLGDAFEPATNKTGDFGDAMGDLSDFLEKDFPRASERGSRSFGDGAEAVEKAVGAVTKAFGKMGDGVGILKKILTQAKLQTFVQSMGLGKMQQALSGLPGDLNQGMNLTNALEGEMASLGKSTRALGANMGYSGKELKKFKGQASGLAYSLGVGADEAAKAVRAWDEAGDELKMLGITGPADIARLGEAFGVEADMLRNSTMRMTREFKMSAKDQQLFMGSMVKMGQVTGDVGGAMQQLPEMLDMIGKKAALMGVEMDGAELAKFAGQTNALAAGFFQVTQDSDKARSMAMEMSQTMLGAQEGLQNMFAGTADDMPEFMKELGIATGDVQMAFDLMQEGPAGMMSGMAKMVQSMKKDGKLTGDSANFIRARLAEATSPEQAASMMNFFQNADDGALDMMASIEGATVDLGKLAKEAHSTGRTLSESMERAQQSFETGFRRIARKEARAFVSDTRKEFKKFNKILTDVAAEGGPMGAIVTKFSELHSIGALALLPKTLRPMASVFGNIVEQATPMLGMLGSMGLRMKHLANPATLAAGGIIAVGMALKSATDNALSHVDTLAHSRKAMKKEEKALAGLEKKLAATSAGTEAYAKIQADLEKRQFGVSTAKIIKGQEKAIEDLLKSRKKKGANLAAIDAMILMNEQQIEVQRAAVRDQAIQDSVQGMIDTAEAMIKAAPVVAKAIWKALKAVFASVTKGFSGVFTGMDAGDFFGNLLNATSQIREHLLKALKRVPWKQIFSKVLKAAGQVFEYLGSESFATAITRMVASLGNLVSFVGGGLIKLISGGLSIASETPVGSAVGTIVKNIGGALLLGLQSFVPLFKTFFEELPSMLGSVESVLFSVLGGAEDVVGWLSTTFENIPWDKVGKGLEKGFPVVLNAVSGFLERLVTKLGSLVSVLGPALLKMTTEALGWVAQIPIAGIAGELVNKLVDIVFTAMDSLIPLLEANMKAFPEILGAAYDTIYKFVGELPHVLADVMLNLGMAVRKFLPKLVPILIDFSLGVFKFMFWDAPLKFLKMLPGLVLGIIKLAVAGFVWGTDMMIGLFDGLITWVEDKFPTIGGVLRSIFTVFVQVWDGIKLVVDKFFTDWLPQMFNWLVGAWDTVKNTAVAVWGAVAKAASAAWQWIGDAAAVTWKGIKAAAIAVWDGIAWAATGAWDGIKSAALAVWDGITWAAAKWWGFVKAVVIDPLIWWFTTVGKFAVNVWESLKMAAEAVWSFLKSSIFPHFISFWKDVANVANAFWEGLQSGAAAVWNFIDTEFFQLFRDGWASISLTVSELWAGFVAFAQEAHTAILEVMTSFWEGVKLVAAAVWTFVDEEFFQLFRDGWAALSDLASGFWSGLESVAAKAWAAMKDNFFTPIGDAWDTVVEGIPNLLKTIESTVIAPMKEAVLGALSSITDGLKSVIITMAEAHIPLPDGLVQWAGAITTLNVDAQATEHSMKAIGNVDSSDWAMGLNGIQMALKANVITADEAAEATQRFFNVIDDKDRAAFTAQAGSMGVDTSALVDLKSYANALGSFLSPMVAVDTSKAVESMQGFQVASEESIGKIGEASTNEFTNSIHTDVEWDLSHIPSLLDSTVLAFTDAFDLISSGVQDRFTNMWLNILDVTASAVGAIEDDVFAVSQSMADISVALQRAQLGKDALSATTVDAVPVPPALGPGTKQEQLARALHNPNWYEKDYKQRFERLIGEVRGLKSVMGAGGGSGKGGKGGRVKRQSSAAAARSKIEQLSVAGNGAVR